ncbi:MAG: zinc ribbon domain-containing protein [candidate division Zixibacteria bacterium]|nr:zinc ribbon domain-containing protein [candidate division Zixibacteria bacterium]
MPLFEYRCTECDTKYEELSSSSDSSVACPNCGSDNTTRLLSTFAASTGSSSSGPSCGSSGGGGCGFS